jgi:hypothetical protein
MFFCGSGEFIVKTIKSTEAKILNQSLRQYYSYLKNNKKSLLCRFLGSYSLNMYEQTFYFVVMSNCFDPKADINERYFYLFICSFIYRYIFMKDIRKCVFICLFLCEFIYYYAYIYIHICIHMYVYTYTNKYVFI